MEKRGVHALVFPVRRSGSDFCLYGTNVPGSKLGPFHTATEPLTMLTAAVPPPKHEILTKPLYSRACTSRVTTRIPARRPKHI